MPNPLSSPEILDLNELARLMNYERGTTDPKFRHKKLIEVSSTSFKEFTFRDPRATGWWTHRLGPKLGLVFRGQTPTSPKERDEPDLPSNMLPTDTTPPTLKDATPQKLETWFWQARGHDGCFWSMNAFQNLFDLFADNHPVRVRTPDGGGIDYVTKVSNRGILEWELIRPHLLTVSFIADTGKAYTTGQTDSMSHSVLVFYDENHEREVVVDLASMQFGDVGRGSRGRSTFVIEPLEAYVERLRTFAEDKKNEKFSLRIRDHPDREVDRRMRNVAKKVKERWDKRQTDHYCEHCGAPGQELKQCSKCKLAKRAGGYYCNEDHQKAAWRVHKRECS